MSDMQQPSRWVISAMQRSSYAVTPGSAARILAKAGIPVFPCVPGGKQPLTAHGFHMATIDLAQVERWWQLTPVANVGIPTGSPSGLVVIDIDKRRDGDGFRAFSRATEAGLAGDWAWTVRTPSGGMHAYFPATPGADQRCWSVPNRRIDFRGDGGYVVAPPSAVTQPDGTACRYELVAIGEHATQVDATALRKFLDPPQPPRRRPPSGPTADATPERLAAWVSNRPEGGRNGGLFWAACRMAESGYDFRLTSRVLGDAAASAGLPDNEAIRTIQSAYRITSRLGSASGLGPTQQTSTTRTTEAVSL